MYLNHYCIAFGNHQISNTCLQRNVTRYTFHLKKEIGGTVQEVTIEMSVVDEKEETFNLDKHPEAQAVQFHYYMPL